MPWLDISEVLGDGYLTDSFIVYRRQSSVDNLGQTLIRQTVAYRDVVGVVTPAGNNSLARQEAYQTQGNAIEIISRFRLRPAAQTENSINWMPDIVEWAGATFIVRTSNDYARFGGGFIVSECVSYQYNPPPPDEEG